MYLNNKIKKKNTEVNASRFFDIKLLFLLFQKNLIIYKKDMHLDCSQYFDIPKYNHILNTFFI